VRAIGITAWATADSKTSERILQEDSRQKEGTSMLTFYGFIFISVFMLIV